MAERLHRLRPGIIHAVIDETLRQSNNALRFCDGREREDDVIHIMKWLEPQLLADNQVSREELEPDRRIRNLEHAVGKHAR